MKLSILADRLSEIGVDSPRAEAQMTFDAWGAPCHSPDPDSEEVGIPSAKLEDLLLRRKQGEPIQYILGVAWFYRECYKVSPDCLIPRSDTEILVDYGVKHLPQNARFMDMCTGSGCVAISILANRPDLTAVAVDISPGALAVAEENARRMGVSDRITFLLADAFAYTPTTPFDGFFSNPPYIETHVIPTLSQEVLKEPLSALDGGEDGLDFYRHFCEKLSHYIYKEGICCFEIGYNQGEALKSLAKSHGCTCQILKDFGGLDRVAILRKALSL